LLLLFLMLLLSGPLTRGVQTVSANQGTIVFSQTHGIPGTLIVFQGIGWYLDRVDPCWVDGKPVRIDRYAVCEVSYSPNALLTVLATGGTVYGQSSLEPSGTFIVAKVPPGTYTVTVEIGDPKNIVFKQPFTVDGAIIALTTTTTRTTTSQSPPPVTMTVTSTAPAITMMMTTTVQNAGMLDYSSARGTIVALGAIVAVLAFTLIAVLRRTTPTKRKRQRT
jgi:hypothetical protein